MNTPCFIINTQEVINNLCLLLDSFIEFNRDDLVAYSIKANYDRKIIESLNGKGIYFEVCSFFEYKKLLEYGIKRNKIVTNIFCKNIHELEFLLLSGSLVLIGTRSELEMLKEFNSRAAFGLRLNLDYIKTPKYYFNKVSRFGINVCAPEFDDVAKSEVKKRVLCLHCHVSGNTREPRIYYEIVKELCNIVRKYEFVNVQYFDIGGGYKIGGDFWCYSDYVEATSKALLENNFGHIKVIYEPGNSLVRSSCSYLTSIINIKNTKEAVYLVVDGTRLHINPSNIIFLPDVNCKSNDLCHTLQKYVVVGNTCKESDILLEFSSYRCFKNGDSLEFLNMGAYVINEVSPFLIDYPHIYYV